MSDPLTMTAARLLSMFTVAGIMVATTARASEMFLEPTVALHSFQEPTGGFGWAVSELRDIDGDGAMELMAGAQAGNFAKVFSGRTGMMLHDFTGAAGEQFGYAIADAGDVDADGVFDVIVGAPGLNAGRAYVFSGKDGSILHTLVGEVSGDFFGSAVSTAGDVNNDGHDDVLIGAENSDFVAANSGRAYIYSGIDGDLIRTLESESSGDRMGSATAPAGDQNNDGITEHVVGARNAGTNARGEAYVFDGADGTRLYEMTVPDGINGSCFGWFFVAGVGIVNDDAVPDIYVGDFCDSSNGAASGRAYVFSGVDGSVIHNFPGTSAGQGVGPGRGAGDVNFDGRNDLVVGAYTSGDGANNAGKLLIYSGLDGSLLRTITSLTPNEQLGFDAVGVGDVNEDGQIDFLTSGTPLNQVYLLLGSPKGDMDGDGDVDNDDLPLFTACYTGPEGGDVEPPCTPGDFDGNGTVDCVDFSQFEDAWTAEGTPEVPDVCDCNGNAINDIDDLADGTLSDEDNNDIADECETGLPLVEASGGRYLQVTPVGEFSPIPVAIELRPLQCFENVRYATADGSLGFMPVFRTPAEWGTVNISGSILVPDATYTVGADDGGGATSTALVTTWSFGDANNNGVTNFEDIQLVVQGFQSIFENATPQAVDLLPCTPNAVVNFEDIQAAVFAFQQTAFSALCAGACGG